MIRLKKIIKGIEKLHGCKNDLRQTFNEILQVKNHGWLTGGGKKQLYFYDDNPKNKQDDELCPNIRFHLMNRSVHVARQQYDSEFLKLFDASSDAYTIAEFIVLFGKNKYDPKSGKELRPRLVNFYEHVKKAARNKNINGFVFDWDHTLQVLGSMYTIALSDWTTLLHIKDELSTTEWEKYKTYCLNNKKNYMNFQDLNYTFYILHISKTKNAKQKTGLLRSKKSKDSFTRAIDALSIVHAGGVERRKKLQSMFEAISKHKKFVVILSKNKKIKQNPKIFYLILHKWGCTKPLLTYSKNKYRFMKSLKQLSQYC